jgi:hypothetical protein
VLTFVISTLWQIHSTIWSGVSLLIRFSISATEASRNLGSGAGARDGWDGAEEAWRRVSSMLSLARTTSLALPLDEIGSTSGMREASGAELEGTCFGLGGGVVLLFAK